MHTPKRTLITLLVILAMTAGTVGPGAAATRAAQPGAVADSGPWAGWLSELLGRWIPSLAWIGSGPAATVDPTLEGSYGGAADPDGASIASESCEEPSCVQPQHGGTADPNG